mmetsp:Transcript_28287/g.60295  ORF Transcript_28287/g.60295 Transcript_28287/m.60295 type:complete len:230 (+) Transcript_28287:338-1027(+)
MAPAPSAGFNWKLAMMELKLPASSARADVRRWRLCATCGERMVSRRLASVRCPSGSRATRRSIVAGSSSIPDSLIMSDDASSDNGGPADAADATVAGGDAVANPAMAPCKSANVNPPAPAAAPAVPAFLSPAGVPFGNGIPKFSKIFPNASTCPALAVGMLSLPGTVVVRAPSASCRLCDPSAPCMIRRSSALSIALLLVPAAVASVVAAEEASEVAPAAEAASAQSDM